MTIKQSTINDQSNGIWRAPGRVNLIGEHTDYNGGFVLPFAIDRYASIDVSLREDDVIDLSTTQPGLESVRTKVSDAASAQGWSAYILGVVWALSEAGVNVPGFNAVLDSKVPAGSGLSSSAALECAVALALNDALQAGLSREDLVLIGQRAENEVVGAPTGILDQSASLLATAGHAVFLDCRSRESELIPLDLSAADLQVLVIDTKVSHAHADGGYRARRESCERGAAALGVEFLRDLSAADLTRAKSLLDEETFRRVRHVVTENARVEETVDILRAKTPAHIGGLLNESHASMRDDFEISCPELDLAQSTAVSSGAIGARMTGGGFGGSAIALVENHLADSVAQSIRRAFADASYQAPDIFSVVPGPGAHRLS